MKRCLYLLDSNSSIGYGHASRCSVLVDESLKFGWENLLLTKSLDSLPSNFASQFNQIIQNKSESVLEDINDCIKKYKISTVILDSYIIDYKTLKNKISKNVSIYRFSGEPDLSDHSSRIINYNPNFDKIECSQHLLGAKYSLINERFKNLIKDPRNEVSVFFGGGGDYGLIYKFKGYFEFLEQQGIHVNIFITGSYLDKEGIKQQFLDKKNISVFLDDPNFPKKLNNSKFSIVSGGTITYESIFLSVPMQIISVAENQVKQSQAWHSLGCADYLGNHSDLNSENLISSYWNKFSSETKIIEMVKHQEGLVDGEGANRIVKFIESDYVAF